MPRALRRLLLLTTAALAVLVGPAAAADATDAPAAATPTTTPTAAGIDAYLAAKGSPMTGQGAAFIASGGRWQLDPRLLVAIAGAESSFGQITCAPFNAWGWGCPNGPYRFGSWAEGIDAVAKGLRTNYVAEGRTTVALIHQKYAPVGADNDPTGLNNHWTINVSRFLVELGGDPNDIALGGAAGTLPLGPTGGIGALEDFGFQETTEEAASSGGDAPLTVSVGTPRPLVVRVRNTGTLAWRAEEVRLRRIDGEERIVGAPFGALDAAAEVPPNEEATFVVQLAAVGAASGTATTTWRLEGPNGPFGAKLERSVRFEVPAFVGGPARVALRAVNGGVAGGAASTVVVHVRNDGAQVWERDGSAAVLLGVVDAAGAPLTGEGWINDRAVGRMLERSAAPGEQASFAFRVRGTNGVLALRPFRGETWAAGEPIIVTVGRVDDALLDELRVRLAE